MNYIIRFSANAESDAEEIGDYYEKISPGLSIRFFKDINTTIAALKNNPSAFHYYKKNSYIRRANLDIFPFGVFFHISADNQFVTILAIIHSRRSKSFIHKRLRE